MVYHIWVSLRLTYPRVHRNFSHLPCLSVAYFYRSSFTLDHVSIDLRQSQTKQGWACQKKAKSCYGSPSVCQVPLAIILAGTPMAHAFNLHGSTANGYRSYRNSSSSTADIRWLLSLNSRLANCSWSRCFLCYFLVGGRQSASFDHCAFLDDSGWLKGHVWHTNKGNHPPGFFSFALPYVIWIRVGKTNAELPAIH